MHTSASEHESLPPTTKRLRAYIAWEIKFWGPRTILSYMAYLAFAATVAVADSPLIEESEQSWVAFIWTFNALFWFWMLVQMTNSVYSFISGAFVYLFCGRAVVFEFIFVTLSFNPYWLYQIFPPGGTQSQWQMYPALIAMALTTYVQKSFTNPVAYELHLYFNGVATEEELKQSKKGEGPIIVTGIRSVV